MKTALITGFTGQVGSQMADFLLENTDFLRYFNTTSENVDCVDSQSRFRILA